ncbi:MAG: 30S ribosomal protein S4 [Parachlamydiales bacterium]|nr:30S ribosomal protein S4 [Parachlamydiales bacterium]
MSRYTGPKNRVARKFGANIFGRARNPLLHKPNPPGMHGAKRKKQSDYGLQLAEKQKLCAVYGMLTQKQLLKAYKTALQHPGNTAHNFLQLLECRLDNIVFRLRLAPTIFAAQQLVAHGHILVDGKKVDRRSFQVQTGMVVSIKEKSRKMKTILAAKSNSSREVPSYLALMEDNFAGKMEMLPEGDQISLPILINIPIICEFLAHTT